MKVMKSARLSTQRGVTMLELVVVIAVGTILTSIALAGFGQVSSRYATREARHSLVAMQARARAHAIERAVNMKLSIDPAGDSAWILGPSGRIDFVNFAENRKVDIQSTGGSLITLCTNPRGLGEPSCNSFGSSTVDLSFVQGGLSAEATILPLGAIRW